MCVWLTNNHHLCVCGRRPHPPPLPALARFLPLGERSSLCCSFFTLLWRFLLSPAPSPPPSIHLFSHITPCKQLHLPPPPPPPAPSFMLVYRRMICLAATASATASPPAPSAAAAAARGGIKLPPALLVTDFDSTLTLNDTLSSLVSLSPAKSSFEKASAFYLSSFAEVERLVHAGRLEEALALSEHVEHAAIDLVVQHRMLAGIAAEEIVRASRETQLRPGALDALRAAAASGVGVHICSANWSPIWISGALVNCADALTGIHTNELEMDMSGKSTGILRRSVVGPADKARCFARLCAEHEMARREGRACVFVGDALPDLTAMLDADIGILIGDNQLMRSALAIIDGVAPLRELSSAVLQDGTLLPGLYFASSWHDIATVLLLERSALGRP